MTPPIRMVSVPEDALDALKHCAENEKAHWSLSGETEACVDVPVKDLRAVVEPLTAAPVREEGGAVDDALKAVLCTVAFTEMADYLATTPAFKRAVEITGVDFGYLATREGAGEDEPEAWQYRTGRSDGTIGWSMWCPCDQALALQIINSGVRVMPDGTSYPAEARGLYPRAQPQAREDAQPVASAYRVRPEMNDPEEWTLMHPERAFDYLDRPGWETQPLYTHPAPDALRAAVEALEPFAKGGHHRTMPGLSPSYTVADFGDGVVVTVADFRRAAEAFAALQAEQKGGAA